jgi:transcriptional regulator with PAS, ATPase and Fis domain
MVGGSRPMRKVFNLIEKIAKTDVTVLITGESGTGKELVARSLHQRSRRSEGPFIPVNTGAISKELIASELFGHEKGAFTGASYKKEGKFELAHDGTLFLDEISTMDENTQISLLRVLEEKHFQRLGGKHDIPTNARVVTATNENLLEAVKAGTFREDLYFRFNVFSIHIPPLRNRGRDIDILASHFLEKYSEEFDKTLHALHPEVLTLFRSYLWPGNVRELENLIMRSVIVSEGEMLTKDALPEVFKSVLPAPGKVTVKIGASLEDMEEKFIRKTLEAAGGNKSRAAKILNISRKAMYNKLKKYHLD